MANIVPQCETISCRLDGNILLGDIEEVNVPDLEIFTINPNAHFPALNVELKVRGAWREMFAAVGRGAGKPHTQLEIQASIRNDYGMMAQASWKCRGLLLNMPTPPMPVTALRLNAHVYEHIIDGKEKYYIDILKYIRRINGKDQLAEIRKGL